MMIKQPCPEDHVGTSCSIGADNLQKNGDKISRVIERRLKAHRGRKKENGVKNIFKLSKVFTLHATNT